MILHSDREGNDCIRKLRCHCIQIMHSNIYSVVIFVDILATSFLSNHRFFKFQLKFGYEPILKIYSTGCTTNSNLGLWYFTKTLSLSHDINSTNLMLTDPYGNTVCRLFKVTKLERFLPKTSCNVVFLEKNKLY